MAQKFLSDIHPTAGLKDSSGDLGSDGQVLSSTGAGTNWVNQEDGATVIYNDAFTATANQTVFTLSNSVDTEDKTQIYIDGAYQSKLGYTVNGTTLTFDTGLAEYSEVEVITFATALASNAAAVIRLDEFTGNNSTTDFALAQGVTDEKVTQVYINGVYQHKDTYSITDVTLTFSTAPPTSADIEVITFDTLSSSGEIQASSTALYVKNTSGSTIDKGIPVYITGSVGNSNTLTISPANASNASHMPSTGLLLTTLANNSFGYIITNGFLKGLTTDTIDGTSTSSNDTIYVKAGGGLTMTKPTGTNLIQNIGKVARSSGGNSGSILVSSILRSNDVPNIASGKIWVGDSNAVATERSLSGDATLSNTGALTLGTVPITKGGTGATSASAAKTALSLDNLDNTSDANKPVSTAGQAALDLKANIAGPTFTGDTGAANLTLSGYLRGPASFVIDPAAHGNDTGTLVVAGNLQVDGTTTTINSTTVSIDDLNFSIATDAADSAAANGAGITIGGAGASLTYSHSGTKFVLNKPLDVTGAGTFSGDVKVSEVNPLIFADSTSTNKASGIITSESGTSKWAMGSNFGSGDNSFNIYNYSAASRYLTISSTGAATFTKSGSGINDPSVNIINPTSHEASIRFDSAHTSSDLGFKIGYSINTADSFEMGRIASNGTTSTQLSISSGGDATFSNRITATKMITSGFGGSENGALCLRGATGANQANLINFGYDGANYQPAYIGYLCTSGASNTNGALIFATRGVTTDSEPTERLTITSGGDASFNGNVILADTKYIQLNNTSTDWQLRADNAGRFVVQTSGGNEFFKISSGGTVKADAFAPLNSSTSILDFSTLNVIKFYTNSTPRLTISSVGAATFSSSVSVGGGGSGGTGHLAVRKDAGIPVSIANESQTGTLVIFSGDGAGIIGSITHNGASTAYNTTSDYRLKENVTPITNALSRVNQLKPSRFNFISNVDKIVDGFIAHEVQEIIPEAINGEKDAMRDEEYELTPRVEEVLDEDGNVITEAVEAVMETRSVPYYQGIDQSKIVPLLTAAIQEQQTIIEDLKARIETLEG